MNIQQILEEHRLWLRNGSGQRAVLRGADLARAELFDAVLRGADLRDADLRDADLRDADLRDADLRDANLVDAVLTRANLARADLRGANLRDADLRDAILSQANVRCVDLRESNIPTGWCRWSISVKRDLIHIGCQSRTRAEWDQFFSAESTERLNTLRNSSDWRRIRAAYLATCAWLDAGGLGDKERQGIMAWEDEGFDIGTVRVVRCSPAAMQVIIEKAAHADEEELEEFAMLWIPRSNIHEDSRITEHDERGAKGRLIVKEWWARQKGWV